MSSTQTKALKVLGTVGAMETFVENFPMSLLDYMHGPVYDSVQCEVGRVAGAEQI